MESLKKWRFNKFLHTHAHTHTHMQGNCKPIQIQIVVTYSYVAFSVLKSIFSTSWSKAVNLIQDCLYEITPLYLHMTLSTNEILITINQTDIINSILITLNAIYFLK